MKLLILGGTIFVGRHLVEAALARGHEVTLFNRGRHNAELYPEVEKLRGDRAGDLSALAGRSWDAVVDTCGYLPHQVRASAKALARSVSTYVFLSTLAVYQGRAEGVDEQSPVSSLTSEQAAALADTLAKYKTLDPYADEERIKPLYGPLKVLCERAAEGVMPGRVLHARAGWVVGPFDNRDRFTYWVQRAARGGEVLAPGRPERPVQFVDARDLSEWLVRMAEEGRAGTFNATGPEYELTMRRFLEECSAVTGGGGRLVWVEDEFLMRAGLKPLSELPMWHPSDPRLAGLSAVNCAKAAAAGLTFRPLRETIRDTREWAETRPRDVEWCAGISAAREAQLLGAWRLRAGAAPAA
jgi:2'-hydroxyisoflavone reductase